MTWTTWSGVGAVPRVAAIVPAFNEDATLADVVSVLKATPQIDEIVVVSDGSTDDSVAIGRALGVRTIALHHNHGKAVAMAVGVAHTHAPILLFVDGDILNLSGYLLTQLVDPVLAGTSAMNVGIRHRGWLVDLVHARTGPLLSGIRCLRREIFDAVPGEVAEGFAIETALNYACRRLGLPISTTVLHRLEHRVKERKRGLVAGARARCSMFWSVFAAWLRLHLERPVIGPGRAPDVLRGTGRRPLEPGLDYISW